MGLLTTIGDLAENTPAGLVARGVSTILDRILPEDAATKEAAAIQVMQLQAQGTFEQKADLQIRTGQIAVEAAEAAQPGMHPREGAMWLCVVGMGLQLLRPVIEWGALLAHHPVSLPVMDTKASDAMLYALLGLGTMHAAPAVMNAARGNS